MELHIATLYDELLVPSVEHKTVNSWIMNLYCVLKRGTYFVKLLYFQSHDNRFGPLESLEHLSVWRNSVDISTTKVMNELHQWFPFVNAPFVINQWYHFATVTNRNSVKVGRTLEFVEFVTVTTVHEVPKTCKLWEQKIFWGTSPANISFNLYVL